VALLTAALAVTVVNRLQPTTLERFGEKQTPTAVHSVFAFVGLSLCLVMTMFALVAGALFELRCRTTWAFYWLLSLTGLVFLCGSIGIWANLNDSSETAQQRIDFLAPPRYKVELALQICAAAFVFFSLLSFAGQLSEESESPSRSVIVLLVALLVVAIATLTFATLNRSGKAVGESDELTFPRTLVTVRTTPLWAGLAFAAASLSVIGALTMIAAIIGDVWQAADIKSGLLRFAVVIGGTGSLWLLGMIIGIQANYKASQKSYPTLFEIEFAFEVITAAVWMVTLALVHYYSYVSKTPGGPIVVFHDDDDENITPGGEA